jgi:hypothetical protein
MFVRRKSDESASLRSSEEGVLLDEVSEPACEGFTVTVEEEEDSVEWVGVGGRDTGPSPLGVSFSSGESSQASSSEGKRGKLFRWRVSALANWASCK